MTDNEKVIEGINRKLARMTLKQLTLMFIVAARMAEANAQEEEAEEATN